MANKAEAKLFKEQKTAASDEHKAKISVRRRSVGLRFQNPNLVSRALDSDLEANPAKRPSLESLESCQVFRVWSTDAR